MKSDAQIEKIWFMGREVTDADRVKFEKVFEEPIEDFELFKAILAVSVKPEHLLARNAFGKALQYGYCGYSDGGREAKAMIRRVRRKMGYKVSLLSRAAKAGRSTKKVKGVKILRALNAAIDAIFSLFRN